VAVHILAMLALEPDEYFSSERIARSVGTNSVVVRRLLSRLQKAGWVTCQAGVHGGARLNVDPCELNLLQVFDCVETRGLFCVHASHPECPVACSVQEDLQHVMQRAEEGMRAELARMPLSYVTDRARREVRRKKSTTAKRRIEARGDRRHVRSPEPSGSSAKKSKTHANKTE
jgi:DNA-binding IscR family transcriptional regulator